jgi:cysteine desulfurase
VLVALGVPERYQRGSLRITLGKGNTMADIDRLLEVLPPAVEKIRALAPAAG